ncbi:MAG: hypothetical protein ACPG51_21055 [Thiolinea sp.]
MKITGGFIFLSGLLILSNLLWFIESRRVSSQLNYHATQLCELDRLLVLRSLLPAGDAGSKLTRLCQSEAFGCEKQSGLTHISFDNLTACPLSGRPYCGYLVQTDGDNNITSVNSAYPCH